MEQCLLDYPALQGISGGANPALRGTTQLEAVRAHAVELAQEQVTADFKELATLECDANDPERKHHKDSLLVRLKKLQPGCTANLRAMRKPDGSVTLEPMQMAAELSRYWSDVFQAKAVDLATLPDWWQELREGMPPLREASSGSEDEHRTLGQAARKRRRRETQQTARPEDPRPPPLPQDARA